MSRPETLQKKYMGRLAKSALLFMKSLLCMDPELRPNTLASLNHPYFEDLNQQQQMMQQRQQQAIAVATPLPRRASASATPTAAKSVHWEGVPLTNPQAVHATPRQSSFRAGGDGEMPP